MGHTTFLVLDQKHSRLGEAETAHGAGMKSRHRGLLARATPLWTCGYLKSSPLSIMFSAYLRDVIKN